MELSISLIQSEACIRLGIRAIFGSSQRGQTRDALREVRVRESSRKQFLRALRKCTGSPLPAVWC
jgi:hypothetical protein